ncbi:hypothetical protein QP888_05105 [Corynebacterium sp. MSK297]|uniref:hypothetical protein n=1 Tax=Corynebacterium sp. MSK297 TaxID=3050221 RepID=UPI00255132E2|nr:hypothetical protein [Corynebacterium sp. MSK297]MDK8845891.1 hypothetical protein [Corynebacterium sp. MSK297]
MKKHNSTIPDIRLREAFLAALKNNDLSGEKIMFSALMQHMTREQLTDANRYLIELFTNAETKAPRLVRVNAKYLAALQEPKDNACNHA